MSIIPHDLLPIERPLESDNEPSQTYFYENVVQHLIPDIVKLEANGIPIDLDKVAVVEDTVNTVLERVYEKLENNKTMLKYLTYENTLKTDLKAKQLQDKKKSFEDFLVPFNDKNKVHRTYVVNTYLKHTNREDLVLHEWSIQDLKILNQIISSTFIQNLLNHRIDSSMQNIVDKAMHQLATDKATIYNKNKIDTKIEELKDKKLIRSFNPGSPLQKQKFFSFFGIESEKETKTGNPQWDKKELERLQKLLSILIEGKENECNKTDVSS